MSRKELKDKIVHAVLKETLLELEDSSDLETLKGMFKDSKELIDKMYLDYVPSSEQLSNCEDVYMFFKTVSVLFNRYAIEIQEVINLDKEANLKLVKRTLQ